MLLGNIAISLSEQSCSYKNDTPLKNESTQSYREYILEQARQ
jgi:hypothetical protein